MLTEVVTFWDGKLDALRQLCLRSQLAAGHRVTVYSFGPIANLPNGVRTADAEEVLPREFAEKLRPSAPDGSWVHWTPVQFSDFFRMRLMARGLGLWLDADVLLLRPVTIDPARPYFAQQRRRQLGNSVLYLPPADPIVAAFEDLIEQEELTPEWLSIRHRLTFWMHMLRGRSQRMSDVRLAVFGPAALTTLARRSGSMRQALPKKSFYTVHYAPKLFFDPSDVSALVGDPAVIGCHVSPKTRGNDIPIAGSLHAWAAERFGS